MMARAGTTIRVPFVDLAAQLSRVQAELWPEIRRVIESGRYVLGEDVEAFESAFAAYLGVRHVIGVGNGTDAMTLILRALGLGPGDEVILPALTFVATAEAVAQAGARPVLVDIDPRTYTLDPDQVEDRLTPRTRAVIAVHLYGQLAPMVPLLDLSRRHGIALLEDAAQAHGATEGERRAGSLGRAAAFSFYPSKNLGALGDAGAVTTNDDGLAAVVRRLRNHGAAERHDHEVVGYNSRLDALQAVVLRVKLRHLDAWNEARRAHAAAYTTRFQDLPGLVLPWTRPGARHVYHLYVARVAGADREVLRARLQGRGIETGVHYPHPVHLTPAFASLGHQAGDFFHAERSARSVVSLPMFPELTEEQITVVAESLIEFVRAGV
jgi:dTDP-4-amino-4,6-dideoxygalactose transaminase